MDLWIVALIIAGIGVVMHGIFTGLALIATWYFGHLAELKILKEAQDIHKEVTDQIKKMNDEDAELDKIDIFLEEQKKMMTGYRSEITRSMAAEIGGIIDQKLAQHAPGSPGAAQSTADRLIGIAETVAAGMVMAQG